MPKLKRDTIGAAEIGQYLATDDDFAFELACFRQLHATPGLTLSHGGTYSDPVTNVNRQFDIQATLYLENDRQVSLAIECKNLKPYFPLLVSRVMRQKRECFHDVLVPPAPSERPSFSIRAPTARVKWPASMYSNAGFVGKSTVQVGVYEVGGQWYGADSEVHDKWAQAVASAYSMIRDAASGLTDQDSTVTGHIVIPVVVVPDGMLWVCDYDAQGTPSLPVSQANEVQFFLGHSPWRVGQTFSYTMSHLHFVTKSGLASFVAAVLEEDGDLAGELFPDAMELLP